MTLDIGSVITGVWCEICETWAPLDEADVIFGVVAHTGCLPTHWVESDTEVQAVIKRPARRLM